MKWPGLIPLLASIFGFSDVFDRPLACYACKRRLREVTGASGCKVVVCPKWHSAVIEVRAQDVRSQRSLQEAAPNVRAVVIIDGNIGYLGEFDRYDERS
jgi:hypothetical protein